MGDKECYTVKHEMPLYHQIVVAKGRAMTKISYPDMGNLEFR